MSGPIALVTGAGSGVGRASTLTLCRHGYTVYLAGRRADALQETVEQAESGRAIAVSTDVAEADSVAALFDLIRQDQGRLDLLFNNAGTNTTAVPTDELDVDQWRMVIDINLTGTFLCTRQAMALMKTQRPRGGRIVNNGSVSAQVPRPNAAAYTASKFGVAGLTRSTALDGRAFDIACGQIDIGNAATEMTERMNDGVLQPDGSVRPEPRIDVQNVADAVLYMASLPLDANVPFITVMATGMPLFGRG
ncbi:MAG: SDR family NAD(P)-dependent oxidoreductase [Spirochaetaceae bacterium]|nr:SDR family NAD(P)-dependent oxidoreductase [Spirochaetaceae bacterium]